MKPIPRWLFVPPAVALLLILGPMTMQGSGLASPDRSAQQGNSQKGSSLKPAASDGRRAGIGATGEDAPASTTPTLPATPGLWQIGSALLGVLLLGGIGIYGLRRLRGGATPTRGSRLMTLRQTLRLTQRGSVHAIEFDDRILLIGESERGLTLIETGSSADKAEDEAAIAARAAALLDAATVDDEGAVPKNLLIPRPDRPGRATPRQPVLPKPTTTPSLNDFRALLQKAGRA
jgi:flagellar biogenesis protein FliO